MAISIDDIKKLRAMTGAGLADVKKALTEAEGDAEEVKPKRAARKARKDEAPKAEAEEAAE